MSAMSDEGKLRRQLPDRGSPGETSLGFIRHHHHRPQASSIPLGHDKVVDLVIPLHCSRPLLESPGHHAVVFVQPHCGCGCRCGYCPVVLPFLEYTRLYYRWERGEARQSGDDTPWTTKSCASTLEAG